MHLIHLFFLNNFHGQQSECDNNLLVVLYTPVSSRVGSSTNSSDLTNFTVGKFFVCNESNNLSKSVSLETLGSSGVTGSGSC